MAGHIGEIKQRLEMPLKVVKKIDWKQPSFNGWYTENWSRYIFEDAEGNVLTWKTQNTLVEELDCGGSIGYKVVTEGSLIKVKATIKAHTEYNEVPQTELTRVKLIEVLDMALSQEEIDALKRAEREARIKEQMDSLKSGDKVVKMPYRQYKEHYSDCETVIDSYESDIRFGKFIKVIIREGRLKNSGVRGQRFFDISLVNELGEMVTYKAVNEFNALARANKEHPDHQWTVDTIRYKGMIL